MAVHDCQQHREAVGIETLGDAPRRTKAHAIDERLHLDEQRPAAIARHRDDAPGRRLGRARQEDGRRIAHFLEAGRGHGEEAQLVDGAEAVLGGAHDAIAAAGLALEVQHGVDQVLEQARAGDGALLGDVADDDHRRTGRLGKAHELRGAFAQLRYRTGGGLGGRRLHRLDRIDHQQRRAPLGAQRQDRLQLGLRDQPERAALRFSRPARRFTCATDSSPLA